MTWGHLLTLAALLAALSGATQLAAAGRWRGPDHGRGTPGYARARDARRAAAWSFAAAALILALAWLTPLSDARLG